MNGTGNDCLEVKPDHLENVTFRFSNIGGSRNSFHFLSNVLTSHLGIIVLDFHFFEKKFYNLIAIYASA